MSFEKKILCIGAGYVGGPTMAVIALKCGLRDLVNLLKSRAAPRGQT